jgi:hypothetical protein
MKVVELYGRYAVQIEGLSRREAARQFGIDPRTVAKMLAVSVPSGYRRRRSNRSGNQEIPIVPARTSNQFAIGQSFRWKLPHHQVVRDGRFVAHLLHEESHSRRRTDIPNIARPLLIDFDCFPRFDRRR